MSSWKQQACPVDALSPSFWVLIEVFPPFQLLVAVAGAAGLSMEF